MDSCGPFKELSSNFHEGMRGNNEKPQAVSTLTVKPVPSANEVTGLITAQLDLAVRIFQESKLKTMFHKNPTFFI
jgi:hypothetical protein